MKLARHLFNIAVGIVALAVISQASDSNWPQWRGLNRDGKASGFDAPKTWPKELTQKWKVTVGEGVASPALVDNKLYVFSREDNQEILRCLDAATGSEIWHDKYDSPHFSGNDEKYQGPRSSPTVGEGKVVTVGVLGIVNCYVAASGEKRWTKEIGAPPFHAASSPIITDGLCIAQTGGARNGGPTGITAFDLNTGEEKWKWAGDGAAYASPVALKIGDTKVIVAVTLSKLVAVNAADGKGMWEIPCRQARYQSASPVVDGQTVIYAGPMQGLTATTLELKGDALAANELWRQTESSLMYNTPVLCGGALYGISGTNNLFCLDAQTGELGWSTPITQPGAALAAAPPVATPAGGPPGGRGRGAGRGLGNPNIGYGTVVDAGSVLMALSQFGQLVVFEPNAKEFTLVASYKVADGDTYAYPIITGSRIYVKDKDALTMWGIE